MVDPVWVPRLSSNCQCQWEKGLGFGHTQIRVDAGVHFITNVAVVRTVIGAAHASISGSNAGILSPCVSTSGPVAMIALIHLAGSLTGDLFLASRCLLVTGGSIYCCVDVSPNGFAGALEMVNSEVVGRDLGACLT